MNETRCKPDGLLSDKVYRNKKLAKIYVSDVFVSENFRVGRMLYKSGDVSFWQSIWL